MSTPYHKGEIEVQKKAGVRDLAERSKKVISHEIPSGALTFIDKQPMVIASSLDENGNIWASILAGKPEFMHATSSRLIEFDLSLLVSSPADFFWKNIKTTNRIGTLFIELSSRRRLRVNGSVTSNDNRMSIHVEQAYPNCPKYIQRREIEVANTVSGQAGSYEKFDSLDDELKTWVEEADTFFVGSADEQQNLDVNHRGGNPGFINIIDENTLQFPDYEGNKMFNTFGNFMLNPKTGLLFVDFENGKTLQMMGTSEILWDQKDPENRTGGTGRFWNFYIEHAFTHDTLKNLEWNFLDYSPHNP